VGIGHFVGAWRIDAFDDAEVFKKRMDTWIEGVKRLSRSPGVDEILVPGEPEWRMEELRMKQGIPLSERVYEDLFQLSKDCGIEFSLD
ncbi:MAG: Ldh family oxidoreductase, partial [Bacteroidota bacterium]|nr:Ldh family oxidoreductase [Bacteroidota bacterium]